MNIFLTFKYKQENIVMIYAYSFSFSFSNLGYYGLRMEKQKFTMYELYQ